MSFETLEIKRVLNCSKRKLFDAWSSPSLVSKWFYASPNKVKDSIVECHFHVGGQWSVTMYFPDNTESKMYGVYQEIDRYSSIVFTWNSALARDGLVKLSFKALSPNRTELILVHSNLESQESKEVHNQGWVACLANLEKFIHGMVGS